MNDTTTELLQPTDVPLEEGVANALVWVFISFYVLGLLGLALWSWMRNKNTNFDKKQAIRDHFVAGRTIPDFVLAMTTFATIFSGYTVVGVPGEMYFYGFFAFRWLLCTVPVAASMLFFASRLQFLSQKRDYVSPTDFITDRFNSHTMRAIASFGLAFPALVYVMAQFRSMGFTIEALSDGNFDGYVAGFLLAIVMCLYEVFGGVRAIAYTDTVQAIFLILGFLLFFYCSSRLIWRNCKCRKLHARPNGPGHWRNSKICINQSVSRNAVGIHASISFWIYSVSAYDHSLSNGSK